MSGSTRRRTFLGLLFTTGVTGCLRSLDDDAETDTSVDTPTTEPTTATSTPTDVATTEPSTPTSTPPPEIGASNLLSHRWEYDHRGGQLLVDGDSLFVSGETLERLSLTEGFSTWYAVEGGSLAEMTAAESVLYAVDRYGEGSCYCIEKETGSVKWRWQTNRTFGSGPRFDGSRVVVALHDSETEPSGVYGLDGSSGNVVWAVEEDEGTYGELSQVVDGEVYAGSTGTPETHRIRTADGTVDTVAEMSTTERIVATSDAVYLTDGYHLRRVPRDLGSTDWEFVFEGSGPRRPPTVEGNAVYIGVKGGAFHRLDAGTGEAVWTYPYGFDNLGAYAVGSRYVWMADRGILHAIDKQTGEGQVVGRMPDQDDVTGSVDGMVVSDGILVTLTNAVNAYDITAIS